MLHNTASRPAVVLTAYCLYATAPPAICIEAVLESGHSRIPVYRREDRTDIIGLVRDAWTRTRVYSKALSQSPPSRRPVALCMLALCEGYGTILPT